MFLAPVAQLIPTYACRRGSDLRRRSDDGQCQEHRTGTIRQIAVAGFLTIAIMPLTYNISYGIAFGLISYVFIKIFTGKIKEVNAGTWIITILFALMFFLTH